MVPLGHRLMVHKTVPFLGTIYQKEHHFSKRFPKGTVLAPSFFSVWSYVGHDQRISSILDS